MTRKKNGFWNLCFSCWPGAGQMYQGFLKRGVSIMALFMGAIFLVSFLKIDEFTFALPVIWFFGFFDSINRNSLPEEDFRQLTDHFLFFDDRELEQISLKKYRVPVSLALIVGGIYILVNNFMQILERTDILPDYVFLSLDTFWYYVPQLAFSIIIIWVGVYLIRGKRNEINHRIEKEEGEWNEQN